MDVKTIAVAILGGAFDSNELGDNDIACVPGALEDLQAQHVTGCDDVQLELVERSHVERLTAERDALQQLLNARDEEVGKLRSALKFYADQDHFYHGDENWDSVSGEPHNILWHAEEPYSVENGWFARQALLECSNLSAPTEPAAKTEYKCRVCNDTGCPDCYLWRTKHEQERYGDGRSGGAA